MTDDTSDDGKWLTYQQLAEVRRISKPSAIRLVMRHRWRRQRDNERVVRVLVPPDMLESDRAPYDASDDATGDELHDTSVATGALAVLEDALGALREQLNAANARADHAETGRAEERRRADDLRERLIAMQEQLADAHAALQAAAEAGARAGRAEQGRDEERGRADRADAALTAERARADALRDRLDAQAGDLSLVKAAIDRTQAEARAARERAEALQREDDARKARGLLARLRAAVRGE